MQMTQLAKALTAGVIALGALGFVPLAGADAGHGAKEDDHVEDQSGGGHMDAGHMGGSMMPENLEEMREMHREHEHGHDFAAMEHLSPEQRDRVLGLMRDVGLALPPMNPARGRDLFLTKGCIACHSVNGVGGDLGPSLNAGEMPEPMNAFEFAARMWRGAPAMTQLQEEILGEVITLSGQDLADIIAFAHDENEQAKLAPDEVPAKYRELIEGQ